VVQANPDEGHTTGDRTEYGALLTAAPTGMIVEHTQRAPCMS
jgi:hypothetical protein